LNDEKKIDELRELEDHADMSNTKFKSHLSKIWKTMDEASKEKYNN